MVEVYILHALRAIPDVAGSTASVVRGLKVAIVDIESQSVCVRSAFHGKEVSTFIEMRFRVLCVLPAHVIGVIVQFRRADELILVDGVAGLSLALRTHRRQRTEIGRYVLDRASAKAGRKSDTHTQELAGPAVAVLAALTRPVRLD